MITVLAAVSFLAFLFAIACLIADRTQPDEPEPFEQSSHVKKVAK